MSGAAPKKQGTRPCPECGSAPTPDDAPFCSPRCRRIDLNRWLSDGYVLPGPPVQTPQDDD